MSLHAPEVETRDPAEQRARDEAALAEPARLAARALAVLPRQARRLRGRRPRRPPGPPVHDQGGAARVARRRAAARPPPRRAARGGAARSTRPAARPATRSTSRSPTPTSPAGSRSARAPTRANGIAPGRRAVLTYNSGPFVAGAVLDAWTRIGATVIPVGSGNTERLVQRVPGPRRRGARLHALLRDLPRRLVPRARHRPARASGSAGSPSRASPAAASTPRATRSRRRSAPPCARRWGSPTSRPRCGASARSRRGMHFCGRDYVHVELIDPADRRAAAVGGRRRGRARLHLAAPRGDAGRALPQPRPRARHRAPVLVRAHERRACAASAAPTTC